MRDVNVKKTKVVKHRNGKFEPYKDTDGQWRWRTTASNGRITGTSGEGNGYRTKRACREGALSVLRTLLLHSIEIAKGSAE